ncbi:MAG: NUDIX domain-containing protein [bacterium]|nr:NUDIX domain-containing protein [bacterium]
MTDDQIFYVGQKAFIEKNDKILILITPTGLLDFPGGKIQVGEVGLDAALDREVMEETGLKIEIGTPFYRWYFEFTQKHSNIPRKVFLIGIKCTYISGDINLSEEHVNFNWVTKEDYRSLDNGTGHFKSLEAYFEAISSAQTQKTTI